MFLLTISETSVGLSLSIYHWKALPEQNVNMQKYFNNNLLSSSSKRMKICTFVPRDQLSAKFYSR